MNVTNKLGLIAAGMAALAAFPAAASAKEGPYIGVSGGVTLPNDSANSGAFDTAVPATPDFAAIPADTTLGWQTEFDPGYAINGQIGYAFENGFRIELDAAFSRYDIDTHRGLTVGGANIDAVDVAVLTRGAPAAGNPTVGAVIADGQGRVSNFGLFGNVFYDFDTGSDFKPFVGAGIGYQWADIRFAPSGVDVADDSDGGFAYQLMAGASLALSERAEVFGQYTWRDRTDTANVPLNLLPATLGVETGQSIVSAGVRIKLGR
jgi:opacity protein-like surface antigen